MVVREECNPSQAVVPASKRQTRQLPRPGYPMNYLIQHPVIRRYLGVKYKIWGYKGAWGVAGLALKAVGVKQRDERSESMFRCTIIYTKSGYNVRADGRS